MIYKALPASRLFSPHGFLETLKNKSTTEKFACIQAIKTDQKSGLRRKQAFLLAEKFITGELKKNEVTSLVYMETYFSTSILFRRSNIPELKKNIFGYNNKISNYKKILFRQGKGIGDTYCSTPEDITTNIGARSRKFVDKLDPLVP